MALAESVENGSPRGATDVPSDAPGGGETLAHAVEGLLMAGVGVTATAISETDSATDLTLIQWRVLVLVTQADGVRVGELAGRLGTTVPSASRLVRRMEDNRLVTATRDETDRRATIVRPTSLGQRVFDAVIGRRRELIASALRDEAVTETEPSVAVIVEVARALSRYA
jgi:DNA-binding MarR family transcriptional regulator